MSNYKKPLVSVIVPIYNAEKTLNRCVDSILRQTYENLELLLIDDGSTDNSPQICDEYAKKDSRVKVTHKQNGGVASARNIGLDIFIGDYVAFVDNDDWIDREMYETLLKRILSTGSPIASCGYIRHYPQEYSQMPNGDFVIEGANNILKLIMKRNIIYTSLWDKLYSREIFNGVRLSEFGGGDDWNVIPIIMQKAQKIATVNRAFYHFWHDNEFSSLSGRKFRPVQMKRLDSYNTWIEFGKNNFTKDDWNLLWGFFAREAAYTLLCNIPMVPENFDFIKKCEISIRSIKELQITQLLKMTRNKNYHFKMTDALLLKLIHIGVPSKAVVKFRNFLVKIKRIFRKITPMKKTKGKEV